MHLLRLFLALSVLSAGAFAQEVRYNFDKTANFSSYKTYKWVKIKNAPEINQLAEQQLTSAIDAELAKKGLTKTDVDKADLFIGHQVNVGTEKEFSSYSTDFGYGPGWGGGWYRGGMGTTMTTGQTTTIHVGEFGLDMYDVAAKKLVWRGTATKTLDPKAKPDKRQKNVEKGVAKLLKNFPPPPPKT